ncbi:MAG: hypothetical protein HRU43_06495 [Simkaniaceae bacterium]|nr:hypothetical protein [Simkaniaceae bacterium]
MKKLLIFLLPFSLWANYLFVLHDVGETLALEPCINELRERGALVHVIKLEKKDRYRKVTIEKIYAKTLVVGCSSAAQLQYLEAFKGKAKTVCYYDNALEIHRIPYHLLIREFERKADHFLVPSLRAASSSIRKSLIVGNADLDTFEEEVGKYEEVKERVVYFGGYDDDYEEAFKAFISLYPQATVYPHPSSDGTFERSLRAHIGTDSSIKAVGEAEYVMIHRSSIGIKASIAGKKVYSIDQGGEVDEVQANRNTLGILYGSTQIICDFLQEK